MKALTFKRGIHPPNSKSRTENEKITEIFPKQGSEVVIPMLQHIGAPCQPLVEKGDKVLVGTKVGDTDAFVSSPVHASVSGVVKEIRETLTPNGIKCKAVVIENDGLMTRLDSLVPNPGYRNFTKEQILRIIREAGIVGLGGAGFPAHIKLNPPPDKKIDTFIMNAAECEPYLTTDYRVLLEETNVIIEGIRIIQQIHPGATAYIGVETNKMPAIEKLIAETANQPGIKVVPLKPKYPQGAEKQLIFACTGREVPSGGLPADIGCIVNNVDTVIAIERSVARGRPLMRKVVTVSGDAVKNPGNYKVRLGMSYRELIECIGGFKDELGGKDPYKIISGGPMMGVAMYTLDVPIVKTSSGFLCYTEQEGKMPPEQNCIRCGKCVEVCPIGIMPLELNADVVFGDINSFIKNNGLDCIECGACSYVCPANRHLSQSIRVTRREQLAKRKK